MLGIISADNIGLNISWQLFCHGSVFTEENFFDNWHVQVPLGKKCDNYTTIKVKVATECEIYQWGNPLLIFS